MKGFIYIITNTVNGKQYIGKTYNTIQSRFNNHISKAKANKSRPLYRAINKYGPSNFIIESLGEFEEDDLELKEIHYIKEYNTYKNGYNATLGGDGKRYIDESIVLKEYTEDKCVNNISRKLGIDSGTIRTILKSNNIVPLTNAEAKRLNSNKVLIEDINEIFNTTYDCAQFLIDNELSSQTNYIVQQGLRRVCHGLRKSYLGLKFKYIQ